MQVYQLLETWSSSRDEEVRGGRNANNNDL